MSEKTVTVELTQKEIDVLLMTCEIDPQHCTKEEFDTWIFAGEKLKHAYQAFLKHE
ncbi:MULTISPECIES: hypothetical protein [unclassified Brevibacillus]|uniref:hypothetical protein n=1 Tax=unclassified Brevibacillus TaxID=2684853 RepID=UPI003565361B